MAEEHKKKTKDDTPVPAGHKAMSVLPTPMTKMLRKAGVAPKDPTLPELLAAFKKLDKDGDGQLDKEELKEALTCMGVSDEDIQTMMDEADTDKDGKISKDEFLKYHAKKQKEAQEAAAAAQPEAAAETSKKEGKKEKKEKKD